MLAESAAPGNIPHPAKEYGRMTDLTVDRKTGENSGRGYPKRLVCFSACFMMGKSKQANETAKSPQKSNTFI